MLHHQPSEFCKEGTFWMLAMAAEVSFEESITDRPITGETIRATLARLGGAGRGPNAGWRAPIRSMPE
jgi:hypothetical protein